MRWRRRYREPWYARGFERAPPRAVPGGIKVELRGRASFQSWWARRWIEALEAMGHGPRMSRGRSYARRGQVASLEIGSGALTATVQGSRPKPYEVAIRIPVIPAAKWRSVVKKLPGQILAAARLLSGEVGAELEAAFRDARCSLLPERDRDLDAECTCPDWERPCKHVAAVHYVFGAELERDPFLLFALRGIAKEDLLAALTGSARARTKGRDSPPPDATGAAASTREPPSEDPEPLPADPATFFRAGALPPLELRNQRVPAVPAAHLRPLGNLPFWRGAKPLAEALVPIYRAASILACALCLGEMFDALIEAEDRPIPAEQAARRKDHAAPSRLNAAAERPSRARKRSVGPPRGGPATSGRRSDAL